MEPFVIVALGAACAGFVQGLSGFAFALVATSIWAWALTPALVGPLVVFGSLIGQLMAVPGLRRAMEYRRLLPFVAGGLLGIPPGVALLHVIDPDAFRLGAGLLLVLWCPAMLFAPSLPRITAGGRLADATAGWLGGMMGGLGGLSGPAPILWCTLRGWEKDTQRAVCQGFSLAVQVATIAAYMASGGISAEVGLLFLVVAPTMLLPWLLGARLYRHISDVAFRRVVLLLLVASGAMLIATSLPRLL